MECSQSITPLITAQAYSNGLQVGGLMTFNALFPSTCFSGMVHTVLITDKNNQASAFDLALFSAAPGTIAGDTVAFEVVAADLPKFVGFVPIASGDYSKWSATAGSCSRNLGAVIKLITSTLYAFLVCRGTPNYASTSDLTVTINAFANS